MSRFIDSHYLIPLGAIKQDKYKKIFCGWGATVINAPAEYHDLSGKLGYFTFENPYKYATVEIRGKAKDGQRGKMLGCVGVAFNEEEWTAYTVVHLKSAFSGPKGKESLNLMFQNIQEYSKSALSTLKEYGLIVTSE